MKRISAIQNPDGTYHVNIQNEYITYDVKNGATIENKCVATTDIPRADIKITAYKDMDEDGTVFTLVV
jgi:hypothetical protein